jgi:hypothetical protein
MDFGKPFTYVFDDPDWIKKIGFVALCQLIPFLGQLVAMGFMIETMRNLLFNDPLPLPEFDFGKFLSKGFSAFVISFVYAIPMIILSLPLYITQGVAMQAQNGDAANAAMIAVSCICGGAMFLYGIFLALAVPAALTRYADKNSIGAAFKIGEIAGIVRKAFVPYLIVIVGTLVASLIGSLGSVVCVIGVLATTVYANAIGAHFYVQAYRQAEAV